MKDYRHAETVKATAADDLYHALAIAQAQRAMAEERIRELEADLAAASTRPVEVPPGWALVPTDPTGKMLSEPASMLPTSYTLTECCDLFREMWKVALEYAPSYPSTSCSA